MTAAELGILALVYFAVVGIAGHLMRMCLRARNHDVRQIREGTVWLWGGAACVLGLLIGAAAMTHFDLRRLTPFTAPAVIALIVAAVVVAALVRRKLKRMLEGP